ncbi:MAG TPA: right-handed parallel beta-helix repeat-containing protein [Lacunisphaera sp.]|nr:right-handed parallel beta-helix repeat-containing protein [Lacunisphaera sp.]
MKWNVLIPCAVLLAGASLAAADNAPTGAPSAASYPSVQAAVDANPGRAVYLPPGEFRLTAPVVLATEGSGLFGQGTLIQTNDDADIVQVRSAAHVRIEGITLRRDQPKFFKSARAIWAEKSPFLELRDVTVRNNRASPCAVLVAECDNATIEGCSVIDYKTITIDDRMNNDLYRYAFRAIDGHGIILRQSRAGRILHNRVIETELRPTEAIMKRYDLGQIVKRAPELGSLASYGVKDGFVFIWHQGAGIGVHGNHGADGNGFTLVDGNYVENAAQGLDLHADFMIVTNNHVTNSYMGMKVFHGGRGVIISNNIFQACGKYGLMLRPGSESWEASAATATQPAREENVERGFVVANNIITDMGYGDEAWRLTNEDPTETSPVGIKIGTGPLAKNPRLMDVIIQGNMVYDRGRDSILVDGKPVVAPPRYKWAIWFDDEWRVENVRMSGNIFHPGEKGVSNLPIPP